LRDFLPSFWTGTPGFFSLGLGFIE
jgi:hypothetical protein